MAVLVPGPTPRRIPGGLFSVATVVEGVDEHEFIQGVDFEEEFCGIAAPIPNTCLDAYLEVTEDGGTAAFSLFNAPSDDDYTLILDGDDTTASGPDPTWSQSVSATTHTVVVLDPDGIPIISAVFTSPITGTFSTAVKTYSGLDYAFAAPFTLYTGVECGMNLSEEIAERSRRKMEWGTQRGVEETLWNQVLPAGAVDLTPGVAVGVQEALGILEQYAADNYSALPVLHATLDLTNKLSHESLLNGEAGSLTTTNGTPVANGGGYASTVPEAGAVPLYISGAVGVRLGAIHTYRAPAPTVNLYQAISERTGAILVDCFSAFVLVDVGDDSA